MAFIGKNAVAKSSNPNRLPTLRESLGPLNNRPEFQGMVATAEDKIRSGAIPGVAPVEDKKPKKKRSALLGSPIPPVKGDTLGSVG